MTDDPRDPEGAAQGYAMPLTLRPDSDAFANNYYETTEGYAWHHIAVKSGDKSYPAYHGNGNRQDLWNRERDDIVGETIIPALARANFPHVSAQRE